MSMSVFGPSVLGNNLMGARRRNGRPDTPEELAENQGNGGMPFAPAVAGGGTNIFNQDQQFPGHNFGSNDIARNGTWLSNWLFNQLGNFSGLAPQVAGIYGKILSGQMPQAVEQLTAPIISQGISKINAQMPTIWRQAEDQLPRALANEAKMSAMDSSISGIAGLMNNVYNSTYAPLLSSALQAGGPETVAQSGLASWQPVRDLGTFDLQRFSIEQMAKNQGRK